MGRKVAMAIGVMSTFLSSAGFTESLPQNATGLSAGEKGAADALEEIVVTAQRRAENLQKVPIAVTAITSESLERGVVTDITDLRSVVPGLNLVNENGAITSELRGIGSNVIGPGFENPVAIYVDGVYYATPTGAFLNFSNIERAEVLKGPQGTLFGRNATGGLIQIVTPDPSHETSGRVDLGLANYATERADAYFSTGLSETVAGDISLYAVHQADGWGKNLYNGTDVYTIKHDLGVRSKLVYSSGETKVTAAADFSSTNNTLNSGTVLPGTINIYGGPTPVRYPSPYDTNVDHPAYDIGRSGGASVRVQEALEFANLVSISAFRRGDYRFALDLDLTPLPIESNNLHQTDRQFTQEVQLLSLETSKLSWVAGLFYFNGQGQYAPGQTQLILFPGGPQNYVQSFDTLTTRSTAGYAQATVPITVDTRITLGVRYTHEARSRVGEETFNGFPLASFDGDLSFNKVTDRVAIDHDFTPDVLGYVSYNRGFKSGGFSPAQYAPLEPGASLTYQPESLNAYEIGMKSQSYGEKLRINGAAFYYDYKNVQVPLVLGTGLDVVNGAAARLYGFDSDIEARILSDFRLSGGLQLLHDRYTSFPGARLSSSLGGVPLRVGSATGNELANVPGATVNLGSSYTWQLQHGKLELSSNAYYNSGYFLAADNATKQQSFVQLNAHLRWFSLNEHLTAELWGKNLTNRETVAALQDLVFGTHYTQFAAPRTYGMTFGYHY
jgi:iron complex outermembrane receptor protein